MWEYLVAFLTLTTLEIVLGIDNVVFIAILSDKLPPEDRKRGRLVGLGLAMISRILLLFSISWIMKLTVDLFQIGEQGISGKDLVLIFGGLFLIGKSTHEIHQNLEGDEHKQKGSANASFTSVIFQIILIDVVFSLDSVITAVGMTRSIVVMIAAIVVAVIIMMIFSGRISDFVMRHPSVKILALAFLLLIGVMLVAEGFGQHVNKGYIYFAMAFSLGVEMLNMRARARKIHKSGS